MTIPPNTSIRGEDIRNTIIKPTVATQNKDAFLLEGDTTVADITIKDFLFKKLKNVQQNIAHFGFSLLILSIIFNNLFSSELITNLRVGESFKNDKFEIVFIDLKKYQEKNYISLKGNFSIRENNVQEKLEPELRIYNQPKIITSEADIKTTFLKDKFITMNTVQNEEYFNIRYQVKPFMIWIWISVLLISFGGLVSLFKKKYEK